jgi:O-antigen/teichoic acid export membrane protein
VENPPEPHKSDRKLGALATEPASAGLPEPNGSDPETASPSTTNGAPERLNGRFRARSKTPHVGRRASYREGAWYQVLTFGSVALIALISSVTNSRMYGVDVIGQYGLAMATLSVVRLLSTAKERPALVRELTRLEPRHPRVTGLFVATLTFSATLTLIIGALSLVVTQLLLSGPVAQPQLFLPTAVNVAGYVFIGNTAENIDVIFTGFRAGRQMFRARLFMAVTFLAISVVLGITDGTVWGLVAANVGSMAAGLLYRIPLIRPYMKFTATRQELRDGFGTLPGLLRFGLKIAPGTLADGASDESGTWMVGSFATIAAVGAYSRGYLLIKQLLAFNVLMNVMLFPTLLERRASGDWTGYARALVDSLRYTAIALILPAAACAGVAQGIMHVFGSGFEQGANALALLLTVPALASISQNQRLALYSLDRAWLSSISGLLRLATTLIAGVVLTWKFGATGAALALVLGYLVDVGYSTQAVARNVDNPLRRFWPRHEWIALVSACAAGYAVSRVTYAALSYPFGVPAGAALGAAAFVIVLVLGGAVNERDRNRYRDLRVLIARRLGRTSPATS